MACEIYLQKNVNNSIEHPRKTTKLLDESSFIELKQKVEQSQIFMFFYKDFTSKYYFWECLIFVRKFILSFLASMTETLPTEIICVLMIICLFFSLLMTMKHNPYKLKSANSVEITSLFVCLITVMSSLIFQSNSPSNFVNFIAISCVIFNLLFFVLDGFCLIVDSYKRSHIIKMTKSMASTMSHQKQIKGNKLRIRNFRKTKQKCYH